MGSNKLVIVKVFSLGPLATNAIIIGCEVSRVCILIDAPFGIKEVLFSYLSSSKLSLKALLLTHSHWDHIADAALVKREFACPLYLHKEDIENMRNPGSDQLPMLFPIEAVEVDHFISEGEILTFGNLKIRVIHTPGHTPGGVCFYLEEQKILCSGDTLFQGGIGNLSFPTARPILMRESLKKLGKLPKETRVIPGHGEETTIEQEERNL